MPRTSPRPMCEWVKARPFLALRPNQKVEILHFICNELLTNDAVVNQVDTSIETVNTLRKDKWVLGSQLRRLFRIKHEKFQLSRGPNDTDPMYPFNEDEEVVVKREDLGDSEQEQPLSETEEDNNLSLDDLNKKIERAKRQQDRCKMKLDNASTRVRVLSYGQDRFRRRYWALPRIGGVLVEGAKSSRFTIEEETEQPMLDNPLHKFPDTPPTPPPDSSTTSSSSKGTEPFPTSNGMYNSPFMASFLAGNMLFNPPMLPHHPSLMPLLHLPPYSSADKAATKPWFSILPRVACDSLPDDKESSPALVVSAEEPPATADAVVTSSSKPSSNHTPNLSASLSAATPHNSSSSSLFPVSFFFNPLMSPYNGGTPSHHQFPPSLQPSPPKPVLTPSAKRRIVLDRLHQHEKPQPIPKEYEDGWWHVKSTAQLKQLVEALLVRGMRESLLFRNLRKHFTYSISICPQDSDKLKEETKEEEIKKEEDTEATGEEEPMEVVNKEEPEEEEEEEEKPEVKEAEPSLKTEPSEEEELPLEEEEEESEKKAEQVALRVDLSVLEQVEGLEEAVAGASMQVKDWQLPPRISSQTNLEFHPSYLLPSVGPLPENWVNPVVLARERLLSLERAIEKRYLKPPLGFR
ncbi:hypothetical protein LAZ67_6002648 [Cordylochernes scorpioides]|uniref:Uncharacterized protein n=1 Tax=Cordylochernes scorpioides TaxID=51811 RepID=A0ABY6KLC2_9ARAC|nr:hypothetical protein LAZ67_6002648 [Cordylochernes scorpioides]